MKKLVFVISIVHNITPALYLSFGEIVAGDVDVHGFDGQVADVVEDEGIQRRFVVCSPPNSRLLTHLERGHHCHRHRVQSDRPRVVVAVSVLAGFISSFSDSIYIKRFQY